ncbi:MAG TPA: hypothetical protein VKZ50_21415 [bacterium]|nr:hypothetical protein [bacterium]
MKLVAIVCAAMLFAEVGIGVAQQSAPAGFLIFPGQSIGPLHIGMAIADAIKVMGMPKSTEPSGQGGVVVFRWYDANPSATAPQAGGLYVAADFSGQILRVTAHNDPRSVTPNGVHDGMTEPQVKAAMGAPTSIEPIGKTAHDLVYASGIRFTVVDDANIEGYRTVTEITVFAP